MLYSFFHLLLLLGATFGVWLLRRRVVLAIGGLLLFPLPAALYNYVAAPVSAVVATISEPAAGSGDCANEEPGSQPGPPPADGAENRGGAKPDCQPPSGPPPLETLTVVLLVNYMTVLLGVVAGLLCRQPLARR